MRKYAELLHESGVARILFSQLAARFPAGMLALGLLIHIERIFGSYGAAGLVLAAFSAGQGVAGPLTSRWMGVWGIRRVLILTTAVCAAALTTIALTPLPLFGYLVVALVAGLSIPPVQSAARTIYPQLVNSRQIAPLFSLDASAQEVVWIFGPVLVTFVSTQISTQLGVLMSAFFLLAGGAWFISSPALGRVHIPQSGRRFGAALTIPTVLIATVLSFLAVGAFGATETSVVASFDDGSPNAGIVVGIWSLASLVGGLLLGHLQPGPWSLARRLGVILIGSVLALAAWDFWSLSAALVIAGLFIAPTFAGIFTIVSVRVKFQDSAEAYGWLATGSLLGAAMGSALAGFAIDHSGVDGGFGVVVAFAAAATLVAVGVHRLLPDLRGHDPVPTDDELR